MLNRRKAMIGWLVYTAAKPVVKRTLRSRAKAAVPGTAEASRAPAVAAIVAAVATIVAAVAFWRRRSATEEPFES